MRCCAALCLTSFRKLAMRLSSVGELLLQVMHGISVLSGDCLSVVNAASSSDVVAASHRNMYGRLRRSVASSHRKERVLADRWVKAHREERDDMDGVDIFDIKGNRAADRSAVDAQSLRHVAVYLS